MEDASMWTHSEVNRLSLVQFKEVWRISIIYYNMITPSLTPALLYYEDIVSLIPYMTSDTTPSGLVTYSSQGVYPAWDVFSAYDTSNGLWQSNNPTSTYEWIQYAFPFRMRVSQMSLDQLNSYNQDYNLLFQATNDDSLLTWTTILSLNSVASYMDGIYTFRAIDAKYFRWYCTTINTPLESGPIKLYGYK